MHIYLIINIIYFFVHAWDSITDQEFHKGVSGLKNLGIKKNPVHLHTLWSPFISLSSPSCWCSHVSPLFIPQPPVTWLKVVSFDTYYTPPPTLPQLRCPVLQATWWLCHYHVKSTQYFLSSFWWYEGHPILESRDHARADRWVQVSLTCFFQNHSQLFLWHTNTYCDIRCIFSSEIAYSSYCIGAIEKIIVTICIYIYSYLNLWLLANIK